MFLKTVGETSSALLANHLNIHHWLVVGLEKQSMGTIEQLLVNDNTQQVLLRFFGLLARQTRLADTYWRKPNCYS